MNCELHDKIFHTGTGDFEEMALDVFKCQYRDNTLYRSFADALHIDPSRVNSVASIPFLPIGFFKTHEVTRGRFEPELVFESSGTTQTGNSRHFVRKASTYRDSFLKGFSVFYGPPSEWCIIGLLPSYLERKNSSLVLMVNDLVAESGHKESGFYLYEYEKLAEVLAKNERDQQKTLLIGVTFALLDFAGHFKKPLRHTIVMETGGMKGRRKEITREEVHAMLKKAWRLSSVHSEYGMTELLSQAYSPGEGLFACPPWMRVVIRDEDDPLAIKFPQFSRPASGLINVIDLANIDSCSFIATDDIGKLYGDNSFEVLGRMDSSDVRGCSLMYGG
jgi:hypothetical protein